MHRVGPTILGRRGTPGVGAARELFRRNEVPHRWVDLDRDPLVPMLETEALRAGHLPLVLFPDGTRLEGPEEYTELVSGRAEGTPASVTWRRPAGAPSWPAVRVCRRRRATSSTTS